MGAKWIAKAVVQKAIGMLPDPQRVNYLFQDKVTRTTTLDPGFLDQRITWTGLHLDALRRLGRTSERFAAVELGSGWYPIVPLCLFLAGAEQVWMLDLEDLGRDHLTLQAVDGVLTAAHSGRLEQSVGPVTTDRVTALEQARQLLVGSGRTEALASIGLQSLPGDARELSLPRPPDLICSNTVFEHVEPKVLEGILARFRDLAEPGTVMSHLIDLCDHYAYVDDTVSVYQFLRFSDRAWRIIDNGVQPMNRLRASEYAAMYERVDIPINEEHLTGDDALALVGEPLAPRFKAMDPADVACKVSRLITRFE